MQYIELTKSILSQNTAQLLSYPLPVITLALSSGRVLLEHVIQEEGQGLEVGGRWHRDIG